METDYDFIIIIAGLSAPDCPPHLSQIATPVAIVSVKGTRYPSAEPSCAICVGEIFLFYYIQCVSGSDSFWLSLLKPQRHQNSHQQEFALRKRCRAVTW